MRNSIIKLINTTLDNFNDCAEFEQNYSGLMNVGKIKLKVGKSEDEYFLKFIIYSASQKSEAATMIAYGAKTDIEASLKDTTIVDKLCQIVEKSIEKFQKNNFA